MPTYDPAMEFNFYFSYSDWDIQGRDTTKVCIVHRNKKMYYYTWKWPKKWPNARRKPNRDEIFIGTGYDYFCIPDSSRPQITLTEFQNLFQDEKLHILQK